MRRRTSAHPARTAWLVVAGLVVVHARARRLRLRAATTTTTSGSSDCEKVGKGEGEVNLISWAGYVEDVDRPEVDWVKPFEKKTGCKVNDKVAGTSDEMVQLMRTGQYDGVSASGNATARLVDGGDVDPVNVDLVPNYKDVFPDLRTSPTTPSTASDYGIPHGRGANLLMWNTDDVKPAPTSWDVMLRPARRRKYKGKISAYDDPIYIADAAVYLKAHQPDLGIDNPYELNEEQFDAAVDLLKEQRAERRRILVRRTKQISASPTATSRSARPGSTSTSPCKDDEPVAEPGEPGLPAEGGRDRMVGHLDDQLRSQASELHVHVDELDRRTEGQRRSRRILRRGAGQQKPACDETANQNFCDEYHADDPAFWKRVYYWETPLADCGDGGEDCKDYNDWVQAWTAIKG